MLDTNVLIHLVRGRAGGKWIDNAYGLSRRMDRPLCSIVSSGEALQFAVRNNWGDAKRDALIELLGNLVVVQLGARGIIEQYARLGVRAQSLGRELRHNDLWIAATTAATNAVLLTTDTDFDVLHPSLIERIWIDPSKLPRDL